MASHADFSNADAKHSFDPARSSELTRSKVSPFGKRRALLCTSRTPDYAALLNYSAAYPLSLLRSCKSSKDHSKPRNEVDTSLKSPV